MAALVVGGIREVRVVGQERCSANDFATHTITAIRAARDFLITPHYNEAAASVLYEVRDAINAALGDALARVQCCSRFKSKILCAHGSCHAALSNCTEPATDGCDKSDLLIYFQVFSRNVGGCLFSPQNLRGKFAGQIFRTVSALTFFLDSW